MKGWTLVYDGFDPAQERLREALCTLGNGYFATRGAAPESSAAGAHYPGTYIAGCYNRLPTEIAGRTLVHEDLVKAPNWLPLAFGPAGGAWLNLEGMDVLAYRQELDLRRGLLTRDIRVRDADGRTTSVRDRRFVHMGTPHLAALETTVTPEDWSGRLDFRVALDGRVVNSLVERYRDLANRHLEPFEAAPIDEETLALKVHTRQSRIEISEAARIRVFLDWRGNISGVPSTSTSTSKLTAAGPRMVRSPAPSLSACTSSTCCRPSRRTPRTSTWECRPGDSTARPIAATSSGTSCSSSPC